MPRLLTLSRAARLVGVRRGALQSKIKNGELTAFEGPIASSEGGHYLDNLCRAWSDALDNFYYEPITGALDEKAVQAPLRHHPQLGDCEVYVAGPGPWVNAAEFQLLEQGVPRAQLKVSGMET